MRAWFALVVCLSVPFTARADFWTVTDLGGFSDITFARGINDDGWVVGTSHLPGGGPARAFLWRDGVMENLGTLGGHSFADAVNNRGQIIGSSGNGTFLWENGVMRPLLPGVAGRAINDLGHVAGWQTIQGGTYRAFYWNGGNIIDLGTLGGRLSAAGGVNSRGQVVGVADTDAFGRPNAFLWENGVMRSLGTLGGFNSSASAINELGWVAGMSHILGGSPRAFLWQDGVMTNLGTLGGVQSWAWDLNDLGWVVGQARTPDSALHAFLWRDGVMTDLNDLLPPDSGWFIYDATGINNLGQIIGKGTNRGTPAIFVLTPPEVPEPASFILLGMGAATSLAWRYGPRAETGLA